MLQCSTNRIVSNDTILYSNVRNITLQYSSTRIETYRVYWYYTVLQRTRSRYSTRHSSTNHIVSCLLILYCTPTDGQSRYSTRHSSLVHESYRIVSCILILLYSNGHDHATVLVTRSRIVSYRIVSYRVYWSCCTPTDGRSRYSTRRRIVSCLLILLQLKRNGHG